MITLYAAMLVMLGFLLAALVLVVVLPAYRRRIERFAREELKRALPLSEAEITADKDRLRAAFAMDIHKLETKLEDAATAAARQMVELNRRDAKIHDLNMTISAQKMSVAEHENARRVLEQAIMDRLPKVEQRLAETRRMLAERDAELAAVLETSNKQAAALEEASQLYRQQGEELARVTTALETRAARNRETLGDPRFDGEVALRTEIEMLRAASRDQAALIARLQAGDRDAEVAVSAASVSSADRGSDADAFAARISELEHSERAHLAEIARLTAQLSAQSQSQAEQQPAPEAISAKAELAAAQAELEEQRRTIQALRADLAASTEQLARQAQTFREELRRLGNGVTADAPASPARAVRTSLAERIAAQRVARPAPSPTQAQMDEPMPAGVREGGRGAAFLKALDSVPPAGEAAAVTPAAEDGSNAASAGNDAPAARRPRLLDRISGLDKG